MLSVVRVGTLGLWSLALVVSIWGELEGLAQLRDPHCVVAGAPLPWAASAAGDHEVTEAAAGGCQLEPNPSGVVSSPGGASVTVRGISVVGGTWSPGLSMGVTGDVAGALEPLHGLMAAAALFLSLMHFAQKERLI